MTKAQFTKAVKVAADKNVTIDIQEATIFDGFGLKDFTPVYATIRQVAALIRWQCGNFGGSKLIDNANLLEILYHGRKRFNIVGE